MAVNRSCRAFLYLYQGRLGPSLAGQVGAVCRCLFAVDPHGQEERDSTRPFSPALRGLSEGSAFPKYPVTPNELTVVTFANLGRLEQDTIRPQPMAAG